MERIKLLQPPPATPAAASQSPHPASQQKQKQKETVSVADDECQQLLNALKGLCRLEPGQERQRLCQLAPWTSAMIAYRENLVTYAANPAEKAMHEEILQSLYAQDKFLRHFGLTPDPLALMAERQYELLERAKGRKPSEPVIPPSGLG